MFALRRIVPCLAAAALLLSACEGAPMGAAGDGGANAENVMDNLDDVALGSEGSDARNASGNVAGRVDDPLAYCPKIDETVAASVCEWFTHPEKHLPQGTGAFNPPATMRRGDTVTVEFSLVEGTGAAAESAAAAPIETEGRGLKTVQSSITPHMAAELTGDGFKISPAGRVEHDMGATGSGYWSWQVTALAGPKHVLVLHAFAFAKGPGKAPRQVWTETLRKPVQVPVRAEDRFSDF